MKNDNNFLFYVDVELQNYNVYFKTRFFSSFKT